jgi:hypothetical protein
MTYLKVEKIWQSHNDRFQRAICSMLGKVDVWRRPDCDIFMTFIADDGIAYNGCFNKNYLPKEGGNLEIVEAREMNSGYPLYIDDANGKRYVVKICED